MRASRRQLAVWGAVVFVLVLTLFALTRAVGLRGGSPVFATPRESVTWTMAQAWADTGRPTVVEPALEELPDGIGIALTPRDGAAAGNELLPKEFPFTVAMYGAALRLHSTAAYLLSPLQGLLLLGAVAALGRQLTGRWRAGLFGAALLLTTLSFWASAATPVAADTIGVAAVISAATVVLQQRRGNDITTGFVAGLLIAVATATRYTLIGPGVVLLFCLGTFGPVSHRRSLSAAAGLAVGLLPVLAYHNWLYGGPLTTGYSIGDAVFQREIGLQSGSLISFDPGNLGNHIRFYLATPVTIGLSIVAVVGLRGRWNNAAVRASGIAFVIIFLALFAFHGGQATWGAQAFVVNASLLRYLLIVFAMLSVFAGMALDRLTNDRLLTALPVLLLALTWTLTSATSGPAGFLSNSRQIDNQAMARAEVLAVVPDDAIVVSRLGSKTFFPQRRVMSASLLRRGAPAELVVGQSVWEIVPSPEQLATSFVAIKMAGYDLFLHNDGQWLGEDELDEIERRLGDYDMVLIDRSTVNESLFEIAEVSEP